MNKITEIAQSKFTQSQAERSFDPATIAVIAVLINQLIQMWQNCRKTPDEVVTMTKSPTLLQKFRLRRMARQELGTDGYNSYGDDVVHAVLDTGKELKAEDIERAYNEII